MALLRSLVTLSCSDDVPKDFDTNTVYHTVGFNLGDPTGGADAVNHAEQIRDAFRDFPDYGGRHVDVKVYDMADAEPRPVVGHAASAAATQARSQLGPGEVALVLSFYSDRNLPRQRGRIYLGPFTGVHCSDGRPAGTLMSGAVALGDALFNIGGENVAHVIRSVAGNTTHVVHHYWCDDAWDTVRKRGLSPTSRVKSDH